MAPKRNTKYAKSLGNSEYKNLSINSVLCPICRSILIEPVTLPCKHEFCLSCLDGTMANTNLVCPLCRVRIGSWLRKAKKEKKLINMELWKAIKADFAEQVRNKCDGIEDNFTEKPCIRLASPGEIRREYEVERQKELQELQKQREAETKASEELIRKLREQEDYQKLIEKEKIKYDEALAKQLAKNLNTVAGPSVTKKSNVVKKQIPLDRFLKHSGNSQPATPKVFTVKFLCQDSKENVKNETAKKKINLQMQKIANEAENSDSSDYIERECRYFKPIEHKHVPVSAVLTPLKVPPKLGNLQSASVGPPNGTMNFVHSYINSPFIIVPTSNLCKKSETAAVKNEIANNIHRDRKNGNITKEPTKGLSPRKRIMKRVSDESSKDEVPDQKKVKYETGNRIVPLLQRRTSKLELYGESPPFHGFERDAKIHCKVTEALCDKNLNFSKSVTIRDNDLMKRIQEKQDLEFAKRLQQELNCRYSTRHVHNNRKNSARQSTLEEVLKSHCRASK